MRDWCGGFSLLLIVSYLSAHCFPAHAANITAPGLHVKAVEADEKVDGNWPTDPVACDLVLEGAITEGDAAALVSAFATLPGNYVSFSFFLCLRSPGGSMREGIKIAEFVRATQRPSIATVVEDGQTCASACALIFLAGNAPARVGAWPQRYLHPRGRLLFHASRLDLGQFSEKQLADHLVGPGGTGQGIKRKVSDLYKDGLNDVRSVISTFQGSTYQRDEIGGPWVPQSLFLEMFAQDPNEWICVDDVDSVGRWNIQVFGYKPPAKPSKRQLMEACHNAYYWRSDEFARHKENANTEPETAVKTPPPQTRIAGRFKDSADFSARYVLPYQSDWAPLTCVIEERWQWEHKTITDAAELATFFMNDDQRISELQRLFPFAYHPAATPLPDLPGVRPPQSTPKPANGSRPFRRHPSSAVNGCSYRSVAETALEACQGLCASDAACMAYSHDALSRTCELKHTLSALRFDGGWTSGTPAAGPAAERSSRAPEVEPVTYRMSGVSGKIGLELRLDGEVIDRAKTDDAEICAERCDSEASCVAIEFDGDSMCSRFESVTGLEPAPPPAAGGDRAYVETRIKRVP